MDPLTIFALAKEAKGAVTKKFENLANGMSNIGGIYGNSNVGFGSQQQPVNQAPMFQPSQIQGGTPSQYSFMPESSNYIPNTDFAQRVTGKQPNKLFQFLSNGG